MWSSELAKAVNPYRETRPYVGVTPTTPQKDAGWRIEPPVSEPRATTEVPCATAAAEPPLEPPGTRSRINGIANRAERGILVGRTHRELVAIGLADDDAACLFQPDDSGRVVGRDVVLQKLRAAGGAEILW